MAASDITPPTARGTTPRGLLHAFHDALGFVGRWNDARLTRRALSRLSAHELDDIGLLRGDIDAIARRR